MAEIPVERFPGRDGVERVVVVPGNHMSAVTRPELGMEIVDFRQR